MPWILLRGLAGSLLACAGALAKARLPPHTWLTWPGVEGLRSSPHHDLVAFACYLLGALLLTWGWWDLRRRGRRSMWTYAAVCAVPMLLAPPLLSNDVWSYVANGWLTAHGHSPYTGVPAQVPDPLRAGVDRMYLHSTSPYGPLVQAWGAVWALMTANPVVLLAAFRLLGVVALVVLAVTLPRLADRAGQDPERATWLVVAAPYTLTQGIGAAHVDLVVAALAALALLLTHPARWWPGAVLAGLAAAVKAPAGVVAIGVVLLSLPKGAALGARVLRTVQTGLVASLTLVACGLVTGVGVGWVRSLTSAAELSSRLSVSSHVASLASGLVGHPMHNVVTIVFLVVLLLIAVAVAVRGRCGDPGPALADTGLLLAAVVLLGPIVRLWYGLSAAPVLAAAHLRRAEEAALVAFVGTAGVVGFTGVEIGAPWARDLGFWLVPLVPLAVFLLVRRGRRA